MDSNIIYNMPNKNKTDEMIINLNNAGFNIDNKIPENNGINFDMKNISDENREELRLEMDPNAIPDIDLMLEHIQFLLSDIETPEMQDLEVKNKKEFEKILTHKYYNENIKYGITSNKIINMFLAKERYDNLEIFLDMCEDLKNVKNGRKNIQDAHKNWCEKMNNKFLYSKFGGKKGFEEKMKETQNTKSQ
jgi:hypothetical protein